MLIRELRIWLQNNIDNIKSKFATTKSNFGNTLEKIANKEQEEVQNLQDWELKTFQK